MSRNTMDNVSEKAKRVLPLQASGIRTALRLARQKHTKVENVTALTGALYTADEFFEGGLNEFTASLSDQIRHGCYETKKMSIEVTSATACRLHMDQRAVAPLKLIEI